LEEITSTQEVGTAVADFSKRKTFILESIHEEEAIEQLELLGHKFYAFRNAENDRFNIAYQREDGSYGLLDFGMKPE